MACRWQEEMRGVKSRPPRPSPIPVRAAAPAAPPPLTDARPCCGTRGRSCFKSRLGMNPAPPRGAALLTSLPRGAEWPRSFPAYVAPLKLR